MARPSPRGGWRWLVPAGAAVLTVLVLIGIAVIRGAGTPQSTDESPPMDELSTAELLDQVATALEEQPANEPRVSPDPGQWFYTREVISQAMPGMEDGPTVEVWRRFDNSQVAIRSEEEGDELRREDTAESKSRLSRMWASPLEAHEQFEAVPEDPEEAVAMVRKLVQDKEGPAVIVRGFAETTREEEAEAGNQPWAVNMATFSMIKALLRAGAPPETQARVYRALEHVPGTHNAGLVDDGTGDDAIAIGWDQDFDEGPGWIMPERPQILLDPDTYAYRGSRTLDTRRNDTDDGWTFIDTRLATGIVDEPGQRP